MIIVMKYLYLLMFAIFLLPLNQHANAQNVLDQLGQAFNNLVPGGGGNNNTGQSTNGTSGSAANQSTNGTSGSTGDPIIEEQAAGPGVPISNEEAAGISNITDIEKATGSNKQIFANNTDIDSNLTTTQGMEKSQLGNVMPGEQDTKFEGQQIQNITQN